LEVVKLGTVDHTQKLLSDGFELKVDLHELLAYIGKLLVHPALGLSESLLHHQR
jgi:hypothetical protein